MTIRYRAKVLSCVVNDGVSTFYSEPRHDAGLAAGERVVVETRVSNVSGASPTLTMTLETSNDGVNWVVRGTLVSAYPIVSGTVMNGAERSMSTVGARFARLGVRLGGSGPNAYVESWAVARDGSPAIGLDLTSGGTFARTLEGSYQTRAPTDGTSAFLAWAASDVRRASEDRGDGLGACLLMEKAATNYVLRSRELENAAWGAGTGTTTADQNGGPLGDGLTDRCTVTSGQYGNYQTAPGPAGQISCTAWVRGVSGGTHQIYTVHAPAGLVPLAAHALSVASTYVRNETGGTAINTSGLNPIVGLDETAVGGQSAQAQDCYVDLVQLEAGYYPTSAIRTTSASVTRPADTLSYASGSYPAGFLTRGVVIVFAPDASSAEIVSASEDWRLVQVGASDHVRIRNVTGTCKAELVCGGSVVAALSITFSRGQALTITARPSAGSLTVSGATTGNGTSTGTGAAWASDETLYVGGDSSGTSNATGRFVGSSIMQAR